MKIIHFIWSAQFGGISQIVLDIAYQQNQIGHQSEVLVGKRKGEFLQQFTIKKITIHTADLKSGSHISISILNKVIKIFKGCDIVHIHDLNPIIAYCAARSKTPIIYTEHGNLGLERKLRTNEKINFLLQSKFINKYVKCITYNSSFTKKEAHKILHILPRSEEIVYNAIALSTNTNTQNCLDTFTIGAYGRLVSFKRFDRLIQAVSLMKNKENCKLIIAGDGPLLNELSALSKKLSISHLVKFIGFVPKIKELQHSICIHVVPSKSEPFGIVALEALSTGKPTLVFEDGGGLVEIMKESSQEYICSTIEELSNKLDYYFENRNELATNHNKQLTYLNNFTIEKMVEKFASIYLKAMDKVG
ncbi:MAG: glycosyltransferase family 4 protein [Flavobacteriales bacterium]|nr:glycosyltransferase family 4 protein [Flavobacteriales bacterium]